MFSFVFLTNFFLTISLSVYGKKNCFTKETCSDCIQDIQCIWCSSPHAIASANTIPIHCISRDITTQTWCPSDKIINPETSYIVDKNETLQSQKDGTAVQISPQKVKLALRKGEEFVLPFQYRQAENYPVDLYYIMDLSNSMEVHREKLGKLGGKLAEAMKGLTNNFRLGFGSFVDKTDMPFIKTTEERLASPCRIEKQDGQKIDCVPAYSFKNHMSLTDDIDAFSEEVQKAKISGNLDFPEGGFDAIMQAMVCKKEIGWREHARHLIVFSTDAEFHIAGDGKLAGIVEPNDAKCHMKDNQYTHDLVYDYPSISQINYVAKQNNINLIFAIVGGKDNDRILKVYEKLQQRIENSVTGGLTKNSDNVVSLIADNYNKIVDSVVITDDSKNDVEIKYSSTCSKPKENGCSNIHIGEIINFTASIKALHCQPTGSLQVIKIKPEGIDESLEIELTVACDCPCEQKDHPDFVLQASNCTDKGDLKCGICSCYPGRFGRNCECDRDMSNTDDVSFCKQNQSSDEICSGMGSCICGKCDCIKRPSPQIIYGKYCQCDNYSCKRNNGHVCSGKDNGICDCGECNCLSGWTGDACECPDTNTTCIAPGSGSAGLVCSGKGSCVCGECQCLMVDGYAHSGRYCEECASCPGQRCQELINCVECQAYKSGVYDQSECSIKCTSFTVTVVDKINEDDVDESIKTCRTPDNSGCTIIFQYTYGDNKELVVTAQRSKICTERIDILAVILGVVGSVVLAGFILLIIWKAFTTIHDRKEYAKFEKERANAKWSQSGNPLYKKATSEFQNPLYNQ